MSNKPTHYLLDYLWTFADACIKYAFRFPSIRTTLDGNTLYNVHVVEKLIQLTVESNAEIIANSHLTEDLT